MLLSVYSSVGTDFGMMTLAKLQPLLDKAKNKHEKKDASPSNAFIGDQWSLDVQAYLQNKAGSKINDITNTTRYQLSRSLQQGVGNGESMDELSQRVTDCYAENIGSRAGTIARTEVLSASNYGSRVAALSTGLELTHEWISTGGARTREWHAEADGQIVPMDQPFEVGGEELMFPGDDSMGAGASNLINCRCVEGYDSAEVDTSYQAQGIDDSNYNTEETDTSGQFAPNLEELLSALTPEHPAPTSPPVAPPSDLETLLGYGPDDTYVSDSGYSDTPEQTPPVKKPVKPKIPVKPKSSL